MTLLEPKLAVACDSPFVPPEWLCAHGVCSVRLPILQPPAPMPMGVCAYAGAYVHALREAPVQGAVFTTACDQMRRAAEMAARECSYPVFLLHAPATWQTSSAHRLYASELARLGGFLCRLGGERPSNASLAEVMNAYDTVRRRLRDARPWMPARVFASALRKCQSDPNTALPAFPGIPDCGQGIPVAVVGPELPERFWDLFDFIEARGGRLVLDATGNGERTWPAPFDRRALHDDPFGELAGAYFSGIPDAFRRPNTLLYQWLQREFAARGVRGVVFIRRLWCDTWAAEEARLREWTTLPVVAVDADDEGVTPRTATRLE